MYAIINQKRLGKAMKKFFACFIFVFSSAFLASCTSDINPNDDAEIRQSINLYRGEAEGYGGAITVEVALTDKEISSVVVLSHSETASIADIALSDIPKIIVDEQTLAVDVVSGSTVTSNAIIEAAASALLSAGVDVSAMANKSNSIAPERLVEGKSYDVIVIGAGGAGLSAAIEAKLSGADNVLIIEKMPFAGGNTLLSCGEMAVPGNWEQDDVGVEDSEKLYASDIYIGGGGVARLEMVETFASNAMDAAFWVRDFIGVEFRDDYLGAEGGHSVGRTLRPIDLGAGIISPLLNKAEELGVDIMHNTKATELIKDDDTGRVVAVSVLRDDHSVTMTALKGIVVATGGFSANIEMREHYNSSWETLDGSIATSNSPASMGDGIIMAEKIGAQLEGMEYIQLYPFNNPATGIYHNIEAPSWLSEGHFYVNQSGNRFVNEMATRDVRARAILEQDGLVYAIYSQEVADRLGLEEEFADDYAKSLEQGVFYKADTIEEIAAYFDINAANLQITLDQYNHYMQNGGDPFGRNTAMVPMEEGPWFILSGVVTVHHTMGGIMIDEMAHVIDTEGNIMEGLYAAGEVTGSTHGNNRVGSVSIPDIIVFGRIAGTNAALGK